MVRSILMICGILSLTLAFIGMFFPLLPTVPLVLLSSFLFSRSSTRFHRWLLNNRFFGPMVRDWEETKSMSRKAKVISILTFTLSVGVSAIFFVNHPLLRFILVMIAIGVITYIIRIPVKKGLAK